MIWKRSRRVVPTLSFCLFAFTSCKMHVGSLAYRALHRVSNPLTSEPLDYLPFPDLKQWAARPGPMLEVQSGKSIPRSLFIRDEELPKGSPKAKRPSSGLTGRAGDLMGMVTSLLAIAAGSTSDDKLGSIDDTRRQLAVHEFPFVLLQGDELIYVKHDKQIWPSLARADKRSKVTIITKDGTFFGIAQRIYFRSTTSEVLLEGDPTVQSGQQHIKGAKADAIMVLDFAKRRVLVNGPVVEKKLFR
ncbi:MAG: hypothetical protein K9N47_22040 [Prosthecobacter sp.]|uniref:hypothetical protein n=1 Tax=Prosthecobacter sp. TaxID=1965333 RepID=UPI002615BC5A|nr:hypothetical protein [Prosthecobacter sp.]MCF7788821.1 hypothetical protein [Prosthecobacter sp.]